MSRSPLAVLTRAGLVGYGLVHLLFAWLVLQVAFGWPAEEGDQSGALRTLAQQPLGRFLVVAVGVGLLAMTLWQTYEAAAGHRADRGAERAAERVASAGRAAVYLYFAWTALKVYQAGASSSADKQQKLSDDLMSSAGGRWLVALAGLALAALGAGLIWYGLVKRFEKHLLTGRMGPTARTVARRLGVLGYVAKGAAYGIAGILFTVAATTYDPEKARGLDATLRALREQAYGTVLLTLMALGIAAYGAFCVVQARYREVDAPDVPSAVRSKVAA
ncbi:DUF1206 domain-containing protein [Phytohabitans suffuscus]|uniref:DUF1206 domain-containing protein n=1 Tax=Phytohabitans suffuscus TaxID=624315 RepID=A0A6F8YZS4_9ACTN|nr:DUF1206 domain-containing protein [Phytohabitans suffuscus]BCB91675.1 hypothetical protein Psuf_089880 [Phytohabitans suffuscus]